MKIKFLGSGSAWVLADENYHSNILISKEIDGETKNFLYDAGSTISEALNAQDMKVQDLDTVYISHLHADHSGGIEDIAFKTFFQTLPFGTNKKKLYGHFDVLNEGWENAWKGSMEDLSDSLATLDSYFDVDYLTENGNIDFYGTKIEHIRTSHVVNNKRSKPSFGLIINGDCKRILISGDTKFTPELFEEEFKNADIIFHDCDFAEYAGGVHAQFHELCTLPKEIKEKMWLYHYALNGKHIWELDNLAEDNGFAGVVRRGQVFEV